MNNVSIMAVNLGVTTRGQNKTTLETLCKIEGYFLKKTSNVRVGTCFASKGGSLSKEAQQYCQLDVEAQLLLHEVYSSLPDLTLRMTQKTVTIGSIVDIMPESGKSMKPIAQGIVKQVGGKWQSNNFKISKIQVLVNVTKGFNERGVIHYPCDNQNLN